MALSNVDLYTLLVFGIPGGVRLRRDLILRPVKLIKTVDTHVLRPSDCV